MGEGDKVKASLRFKGRQMAHRDLGYKIINRLILDIGDAGLVEFMPRMEGTTLHAILAPSKKAEAAPKKARFAPRADPRRIPSLLAALRYRSIISKTPPILPQSGQIGCARTFIFRLIVSLVDAACIPNLACCVPLALLLPARADLPIL